MGNVLEVDDEVVLALGIDFARVTRRNVRQSLTI